MTNKEIENICKMLAKLAEGYSYGTTKAILDHYS